MYILDQVVVSAWHMCVKWGGGGGGGGDYLLNLFDVQCFMNVL